MDLRQVRERARKSQLVRWFVLAIVLLIIAFGVTLTICAYAGFKLGLEATAETSTVVTTTLTGIGVMFALLAAALALLGYWATSGVPNLEIRVFGNGDVERFEVSPAGRLNGPYWQARARIQLKNSSHYTARNLTAEVELFGLALLALDQRNDGWDLGEHQSTVGVRAFHWYGGERTVPGKGHLLLPRLDLSDARVLSAQDLKIRITAYADGIKPIIREIAVETYFGAGAQQD